MMTAQDAIQFARFVRESCIRLNDAQAVDQGKKEMLAEELTDMQTQAESLLDAAGVEV